MAGPKIPMRVVIDKKTKKVLRYGYCDFESDGSFDAANEEIVEPGTFVFDPPIDVQDWVWDGRSFLKTGSRKSGGTGPARSSASKKGPPRRKPRGSKER